MLTIATAALITSIASACLGNPAAPGFVNPAAGKKVLFIGNSLTYTNGIPELVQGLADAAGGDSLIIDMVAGPDMALVDHWNRGDAQAKIAATHWDYVVLQQGPSSTDINRDSLRTLTKMFAPLISASGGTTVLFSAWPSAGRRVDFPRAAESYRLAAADVSGLYAPVANAWVEAWNRSPSLELYSDGLHANFVGSYLAALVIYSRVFAKSPVGLPSTFRLRNGLTVSLSPAETALLQQSAWAAVAPTLQP